MAEYEESGNLMYRSSSQGDFKLQAVWGKDNTVSLKITFRDNVELGDGNQQELFLDVTNSTIDLVNAALKPK